MNGITEEARPLTSVELLDAAVWREIGSEEPQSAGSVRAGAFEAPWAVVAGTVRCTRYGSSRRDVPRQGLH